jgi:hypothetical protein
METREVKVGVEEADRMEADGMEDQVSLPKEKWFDQKVLEST